MQNPGQKAMNLYIYIYILYLNLHLNHGMFFFRSTSHSESPNVRRSFLHLGQSFPSTKSTTLKGSKELHLALVVLFDPKILGVFRKISKVVTNSKKNISQWPLHLRDLGAKCPQSARFGSQSPHAMPRAHRNGPRQRLLLTAPTCFSSPVTVCFFEWRNPDCFCETWPRNKLWDWDETFCPEINSEPQQSVLLWVPKSALPPAVDLDPVLYRGLHHKEIILSASNKFENTWGFETVTSCKLAKEPKTRSFKNSIKNVGKGLKNIIQSYTIIYIYILQINSIQFHHFSKTSWHLTLEVFFLFFFFRWLHQRLARSLNLSKPHSGNLIKPMNQTILELSNAQHVPANLGACLDDICTVTSCNVSTVI